VSKDLLDDRPLEDGRDDLELTPAAVRAVLHVGTRGHAEAEMLSGARRHGAVATVIRGTLEARLREVAAGHTVMVLQNLGLSFVPLWHYAVVVV
jgi:hypothetical protein